MALSKNEIKLIKSLQVKKSRESNRLFVVEGVKLVTELLEQKKFKIESIFYTAPFGIELPTNVHHFKISTGELERISGLVTPNKVLAVVKYPNSTNPDLTKNQLILVLDEISDPGNLGTILRTADWFGIKTIIASSNTVDLFNPKVIQASMGAVYRINFIQDDLLSSLKNLSENGFELVGANLNGKNLYTHKFSTKTALIMGSESHGIAPAIETMLDTCLTIPRVGQTESLNVAIATAVILSNYSARLN